MVIVKPSVRFRTFTPALMTLLNTLYACDQRKLIHQPDDLVITSANDSTHLPTSRHYTNEALDIRSKSFPTLAAKRAFRAHLETELGPKFRVLLERVGTEQEHLHAQVRKGVTL